MIPTVNGASAAAPTTFLHLLREKEVPLAPIPQVSGSLAVPHATTIAALKTETGVVLAGDRRATMANVIAHDEMRKIFVADDSTGIGVAGSAALGIELVRLFRLEVEHYEKVEEQPLSYLGKAQRLSALIAGYRELAFQGLAAVPLLVGYDRGNETGRIHTFDAAGGLYEHAHCAAIGSGGEIAKTSLLDVPVLPTEEALKPLIRSLRDAARQDCATRGPSPEMPCHLLICDASGARMLADKQAARLIAEVLS